MLCATAACSIFRHLDFKNVANWLRAPAVCNFCATLLPETSIPATLSSLPFDHPEHKTTRKHAISLGSYLHAHLSLDISSDLTSSEGLQAATFQKSDFRLPNVLRLLFQIPLIVMIAVVHCLHLDIRSHNMQMLVGNNKMYWSLKLPGYFPQRILVCSKRSTMLLLNPFSLPK